MGSKVPARVRKYLHIIQNLFFLTIWLNGCWISDYTNWLNCWALKEIVIIIIYQQDLPAVSESMELLDHNMLLQCMPTNLQNKYRLAATPTHTIASNTSVVAMAACKISSSLFTKGENNMKLQQTDSMNVHIGI